VSGSRKVFALFGSIALDGMDTVNKGLTNIGKEAKRAEGIIKKFGKGMKDAGKQMTMLTAPIAAAGIAAIKFGTDFDQAMTQSLAIMGEVSGDMRKKMEVAAREMAKTSTFSATQIAEAYLFLASSGQTAEQSLVSISRVTKFAQAGNFDLNTATTLLTDSQSALGLKVKDVTQNLYNMTRVSDVLTEAANRSNGSVQQFAEALTNKAGSALRLLGKDIEEGVAVLAAYADQGLKGDAAGEALNITLRDLQIAAIENNSAFKTAKVTVYDAAEEMRNMADIVQDLEGYLAGMSDEQRRMALKTLGLKDKSMSATLALVGLSGKIREYEIGLRAAGGATDEVAKKQLESFRSQLIIVKNRLIDLALTLWEKLYPVLKDDIIPVVDGFVKTLDVLVSIFTFLPDFVQKTALVLAGLAVAIGPLVYIMGSLIIATKAFTAAVLLNNAALLLNPFILAAAAVVAFGAAIWGTIQLVRHLKKESAGVKFNAVEAENEKLELQKEKLEEINAEREKILEIKKKELELQKKGTILTEEEKEKIKELAKSRLEMVQEYKNKIFEMQSTEETSIERRRVAAVAHAKTIMASASDIALIERSFAIERDQLQQKRFDEEMVRTGEEKKAAAEVLKERLELEYKWGVAVFEQTSKRLDILRAEKERMLADTKNTEKSRAEIVLFYDRQIADEKKRLDEEDKKRKTDLLQEWGDRVGRVLQTFTQFFSQYYDGQLQKINKNNDDQKKSIEATYEAQKLKIESASMSDSARSLALKNLDDDRAANLQKLDDQTEKKRRAIAKRQAILDKTNALFSIAVNTAVAISKVLANPLMIAFVAIMGAAQAILVASRPLPLADGGLAKSRRGGINAKIAEGGQDEMVLPMRTGVAVLADALMSRIKNIVLPGLDFLGAQNSGLAVAGAGGAQQSYSRDVHLHIGTFIGDDAGVKKLSKEISKYQLFETQRKGGI